MLQHNDYFLVLLSLLELYLFIFLPYKFSHTVNFLWSVGAKQQRIL